MSDGGGGGGGTGFAAGAAGFVVGAGFFVVVGAGFFVVGAGLVPACANAKVDDDRSAMTRRREVLRNSAPRELGCAVEALILLGILLVATGHLDPVQFRFHLMERVVANLFTRPHG